MRSHYLVNKQLQYTYLPISHEIKTHSGISESMEFDQLIEHNLRNIFLEKSYTKCGRETIPKPFFLKKNNKIEHISGSMF